LGLAKAKALASLEANALHGSKYKDRRRVNSSAVLVVSKLGLSDYVIG
jgi:hypothetical protein